MLNELEKHYTSLREMFLTQGWKELMEEVASHEKRLLDIRTIKDQRDLDYRQGQLQVLDFLLTYQQGKELAQKMLESENVI